MYKLVKNLPLSVPYSKDLRSNVSHYTGEGRLTVGSANRGSKVPVITSHKRDKG